MGPMPSLLYYLRRTREQSLRETLNLARKLVANRARAVVQPSYDRILGDTPSKEQVLKQSGAKSWAELAETLKTRANPALFEYPPDDHNRDVLHEADQLLNGPLPWHTDSRSGYTWSASTHYRRVPLSPGPGIDIKDPWDRSRFHAGVVLGAAYRISSDEKYAREFVRRVTDWIRNNPYRCGVNWTSAMEAGIRAANWICGFYLVRPSAAANEEFAADFLTSLYAHARFIKSNLEYNEAWIDGKRQRLNSNHYLCDLVGLLYISILLPDLKLPDERQFAAAELERELLEQTHADGADYEHSTAYHRFVTELLTAGFLLLRANAYDVRPEAWERLSQMNVFLASCIHPDGTLAQIGDNDGGKLFPFPLVRPDPETGSRGFSESGFYSMRGRDSHVIVSAARLGMRGFGSHSHNDALSFEYWWGGQSWFVDPGTYAYLRDPEARNWFRSTEAHNTVRVDGCEINPFHRESIFQMVDAAGVEVSTWEAGERRDVLEASHTGYRRLPGRIVHGRRFEFEKQSARLVITDTLEGTGTHTLEWFFQLHPAALIHRNDTEFVIAAGDKRLRMAITGEALAVDSDRGWYSPAYGVRESTTRIKARATIPLPASATIVIEPC